MRLPLLPWQSRPADVAYVCNLGVRRDWRGRGLGSTLIRACEALAGGWGFDEVYLHAATRQPRLLQMYSRRAYEALPDFDQPAWVLALAGREETRYHRKPLEGRAVAEPPPAAADEGAGAGMGGATRGAASG